MSISIPYQVSLIVSQKIQKPTELKNLPFSKWFDQDDLMVYIRVGGYSTPEGIKFCVTVSNIAVVDEDKRGKGTTTKLFAELKKLCNSLSVDYLVVENVHNEKFAKMLMRVFNFRPHTYFGKYPDLNLYLKTGA